MNQESRKKGKIYLEAMKPGIKEIENLLGSWFQNLTHVFDSSTMQRLWQAARLAAAAKSLHCVRQTAFSDL
jgi:hypothetical protein